MYVKGKEQKKCYIVTGGSGFIGSCFVLETVMKSKAHVLNLDLLTYSGNPENLKEIEGNSLYTFKQGDIGDATLISELFEEFSPTGVINFAAESHVDRSIIDPEIFVRTNVLGTCTLLHCTLEWWKKQSESVQRSFRFLHISTDEVFGSLGLKDAPFTEKTPYAPNSPYSASKAASDHFVRAFGETYGLPVLLTNCSNNYGPRQFPEKLIPLVILKALSGEALPIYGKGENIRDWLHVKDHCTAIQLVMERGRIGESYAIGGHAERDNLGLVKAICRILDELRPRTSGCYEEQITFVKDRPGHDLRYSIDCRKIEHELGWKAEYTLETGLKETVLWYLNNQEWVQKIQSGEYRNWLRQNYDKRS